MTNEIKTPKGSIVQVKTKTGKFEAKLEWNPGFGPKMTGKVNRVQMFVDSEVLRLSTPYAPYQTTMLRKSGILGTEIGSGLVCWNAPYAKMQYYDTAKTRGYDSQAGSHWFDRMKAEHGPAIIAAAKRMMG